MIAAGRRPALIARWIREQPSGACATGKPVYIYDLPRGVPGWLGIGSRWLERLREAVLRQADDEPKSRRGITRPQRGFELFFSKLLERGWVVPPCDFNRLHQTLIERGMARRFDELVLERASLEFEPQPETDLPRVADDVRHILGVPQ